MKKVKKKYLVSAAAKLAGVFGTVIVAFPLYIMMNIGLKSQAETALSPLTLPSKIEWRNFTTAIRDSDYFILLKNSLTVTVMAVALMIILSCMAAYSISRTEGKWYRFLYVFFLSGLMIPAQMIMLPMYRMISKAGLMNSKLALIVYYLGAGMPFLVFYMCGALKGVPRELDDAALIDGANRYQTFWNVVFPLLKTSVFTVTVLQVIWVWNDFLMPMLFMKDYGKMPLMAGIYSFQGEHGAAWNLMFALIILSMIPVLLLYIFFQKYIVDGFVAGAVKG